MQHKAFLYIDGYPVKTNDTPYDIEINWGDGSKSIKYKKLIDDQVPPFYHIYNELRTFTITVTITNKCGSTTKSIEYTPFALPQRGCVNLFEGQQRYQPNLISKTTIPEVTVEGYITDRRYEYNKIVIQIMTHVMSSLPLVIFPEEHEDYIPPVTLQFAVNPIRNREVGVFHYDDIDGKHHCVTLHDVTFTQSIFDNHLNTDPNFYTRLNLNVEYETEQYGRVSTALIPGKINIECIQNWDDLSHIYDMDNPHELTKKQIELGKVDNVGTIKVVGSLEALIERLGLQ